METGSAQRCPVPGQEAQKIQFKHRKKTLGIGQTQEEIAQKESLIPGDDQKPSGHGPMAPALGVPDEAGVGSDGARGPCKPQLFCDTVTNRLIITTCTELN